MKRYYVVSEEYAGFESCKSYKEALTKALFFNAVHANGKDDFQVVRFVDQFHANPNGLCSVFYDTPQAFESAFKEFSEDSAAIAYQEAKEYYAWGARMFPEYVEGEWNGNSLP